MKSKRFGIASAFMLFSVVLSVVTGCSDAQRPESAAPETVTDVSLTVAHEINVPGWLDAIGTVRAARTSEVASQAMGSIVEIRAHEGDRVQTGQVLAILDDAQPRSAVDQATAALSAAEKELAAADSDLSISDSTLKRYQQLYDKKSVSPQEYDEISARRQSAEAHRDLARAQRAQANAALSQARIALGYTQIRAPLNGLVTEKKMDVGTLVSPGMPLFTMEDTRNYRLEVSVDENDVRLVRVGQPVTVSLDVLGDSTIAAAVTQIAPAADSASRSFLIKVGLPAESRLRSGLFGTAHFPRGERKALLIPRAAIAVRGQLQGVYVIGAKQIAELRYVTLGQTVGDQVEVLSGLQDGEKLIAMPGSREFGGKQIGSTR